MRPVYIIDGARTPFLKARSGPGPFTPGLAAIDMLFNAGPAGRTESRLAA